MKLDKSPFVVVSVIGQELLTAGHHGASVVVLEAALKIGTCSLKLRGSVFSALSSAYWSLGNTEKSTGYMQQDLDVAKTLGRVLPPLAPPPVRGQSIPKEQISGAKEGQRPIQPLARPRRSDPRELVSSSTAHLRVQLARQLPAEA